MKGCKQINWNQPIKIQQKYPKFLGQHDYKTSGTSAIYIYTLKEDKIKKFKIQNLN